MDESVFLKSVISECKNIKKYASTEEIDRLDIRSLDPNDAKNCIYGLMTGECRSDRSIGLIKDCCSVVVDFWDVDTNLGFHMDRCVEANSVNKEYYSALETYITTNNAKNDEIIMFIKGESETLKL